MTIWIKYGVNTAMNEPIFAVGNILSNKYNHTRYRVISILGDTVVLCLMDTSKFELAFFDIEMVQIVSMMKALSLKKMKMQ